jgi:apolipoprotein N-acyltransferase
VPLIVSVAYPLPESRGSHATAVGGRRSRRRRPFLLGLVCGGVYFAGTLYWLVETMTTFGGLATALAMFAALLLVAYLALFPAAFAFVLARATRALGARAILLAPAFWVATELGRQYVWDGFPWALLGYSQVTVLPIAQLASVVGVYGLSALLALTSAAVAYAIVVPTRDRWLPLALSGVVVVTIAAWGAARLGRSELLGSGNPVRVAVLQGNIAQEDKWNPALSDQITDRYLSMTRQAIAEGATFIMWPESSTPFYFERDLRRGAAIRRLAVEGKTTLLIGSDQVEPVRAQPGQPAPERKEQYYNAAFLVKPDGRIGAVYRKMHLVPFGEYVPAKRLFFFVGPIVDALSDTFVAGTDPVLLPVGEHRVSTAICYEVIYASLMRHFVASGSELLTTITNDAWYGRSSAAYQHWDQAALRAIEGGRYLARAANTGISGFVDPYGRVLAKSALFEQALLVQDVRFLQTRTIYSRIGDAIAWLSLALTAAVLLASSRIRARPIE